MKKEGKLKQLQKEVNKLKKAPETKVFTSSFSYSNLPIGITTGTVLSQSVNLMSGIIQGLDTKERIGNKITLKSIEINGIVAKQLDNMGTARLVLHKSKEQATTSGSIAVNVFPVGGTGGNVLTYEEVGSTFSRYAPVNIRNHTPLMEKRLNIPQSQISANENAVPFKFYYNFKDSPYVYSNDTLYGKTNTLYLTAWNQSLRTSQTVDIEGVYTIKYRDE